MATRRASGASNIRRTSRSVSRSVDTTESPITTGERPDAPGRVAGETTDSVVMPPMPAASEMPTIELRLQRCHGSRRRTGWPSAAAVRTRSITIRRARSSPQSGTSACNARATRRSNQSDTRYLLEHRAQPRECALHPHLERRLASAGDPGHFLVGQVVRVLEHDRLSLLRGEPLEHVLQLGPRALLQLDRHGELEPSWIELGE